MRKDKKTLEKSIAFLGAKHKSNIEKEIEDSAIREENILLIGVIEDLEAELEFYKSIIKKLV